MQNPLARQTIAAIETALSDKRTAAISDIIQIVQELASKAASISINELAELIGRDPSITQKIISASNTLAFKVGGDRISAIGEAVHALGFQRIRNLAVSILLVESAAEAMNPYEQREIASLSFCSGLMAQSLTRSQSLPLDPELAYVCSSLRNYGKLLLTSFLIEQYRQAEALSFEIGDAQAFEDIFGIQPLQLGRTLLEISHLPKEITNSFRGVSEKTLAKIADTPEDQLIVMAELCVQVSQVTFDSRVSPDEFEGSVQGVLDNFEESLPVELESISEALVEIESNLDTFTQTIGTPASATPGAEILKARVNGSPLPVPPKQVGPSSSKAANVEEMSPDEREAFAEERYQNALARISEESSLPRPDFGRVHSIACEAIREGLGLSGCMIFTPETHEPCVFATRSGLGKLFQEARNRPFVSTRKRDIFGICLNRKEDILIQDVNAGKIRSVIPEWIDTSNRNQSLLILPVESDGTVYSLILGTLDSGSIQLGKGDHRRLKDLQTLLSDLSKNDSSAAAIPR